MKLIAKTSFRNPGQAIEVEGAQHPDHIHQGATFTIGGDLPFEKLKKADQELVKTLNAADRLADATNPEIVKKVLAEVAEKAKVEARAAKTAAPAK